jgi:hypothetical protein
MSNNAVERAVRTIAVGRRNWTFCGSDTGGQRAAVVYPLNEACRLNHVIRALARRRWPASPRILRAASLSSYPGTGSPRTCRNRKQAVIAPDAMALVPLVTIDAVSLPALVLDYPTLLAKGV